MKKIMFTAMMCVFALMAFCKSSSINADTAEFRLIQLSRQQWEALKKRVDAKGTSKIPNYNAGIVITNGLPNVEAVLPVLNNLPDNDLERNKLHMPGRRGDNKKPVCPEPMPYVGQTI